MARLVFACTAYNVAYVIIAPILLSRSLIHFQSAPRVHTAAASGGGSVVHHHHHRPYGGVDGSYSVVFLQWFPLALLSVILQLCLLLNKMHNGPLFVVMGVQCTVLWQLTGRSAASGSGGRRHDDDDGDGDEEDDEEDEEDDDDADVVVVVVVIVVVVVAGMDGWSGAVSSSRPME